MQYNLKREGNIPYYWRYDGKLPRLKSSKEDIILKTWQFPGASLLRHLLIRPKSFIMKFRPKTKNIESAYLSDLYNKNSRKSGDYFIV